jgi:2-polyprenyl-3-methyl-5-hydroxy-6-metoxy-1,4-benzoquinol methylase
MDTFDRKGHWENIYQTKKTDEVSWFQPVPETSLEFFRYFGVPTDAKIIDIGGGDSLLVHHLLDLGYTRVTVLDISEKAITRAKQRLGDKAERVTWIVADAAAFKPDEKYNFWHDRAAFHFLTQAQDIAHYVDAACNGIRPGGFLVMGTFSEDGPKKCSGIEIRQYSKTTLTELFQNCFEIASCIKVDHQTPFNTIQNFVFCSFRRVLA